MKPTTKYCAVYTRKSTDERLEMEFNSLDAQRESCLAYIASQKAEGWQPVKKLYDDGGFSGGNIARPALTELLADIKAGKVHIVVVYKIDRLTRSLMDFAKLVEIFDGHGVTFVSVTQSFNTTTSMGRLTLNVLLSFAQFEREVAGERIRDKIAASKRKGMFMGGVPPLGYRVENRQLLVDEQNAKITKHIFERYLALGSTLDLAAELREACGSGLSADQQKQLDHLIAVYKRNPKSFEQGVAGLKPGTKLVRTVEGKRHMVLVKTDCFEYAGKTYTSLSEVAFAITGTRWNGWLFFGLKRKSSKKA